MLEIDLLLLTVSDQKCAGFPLILLCKNHSGSRSEVANLHSFTTFSFHKFTSTIDIIKAQMMMEELHPAKDINLDDDTIELGNIVIQTTNDSSSSQQSQDASGCCCQIKIFSKFSRRSIMSFCAKSIAFCTPIVAYSIYLVLPYYILSSPEKGWGAPDLAIFYSAASIGETVGSQVVPLAAVLDSNNALFIGHSIQIILPFLGYMAMSSMLFFHKWIFAAGMFSLGFSNALSVVQAYCTEIADGDENFEVDLMSQFGQLNILSNLATAFVLPAIYDARGFAAYCATLS